MKEETKKFKIIDELVFQNERILYPIVAKVYDITIQSDFLTGNIAGTIIYIPGGKISDYQTNGAFRPFRISSHEKSLLTYYYNNQIHTTLYTKSLFINYPNVFSSKVVHSDEEIHLKPKNNRTPTKNTPPTARADEITEIGFKKIDNRLSNVKKIYHHHNT